VPADETAEQTDKWVKIPTGTFLMGNEDDAAYPGDGEGPTRTVTVGSFYGFRTVAEVEGSAFVFAGLLPDDFPPTRGVASAPWWRLVEGASWREPEGPGSTIEDRGNHPVVQVAWMDAMAYCDWSETRMPTEAEWERAARGGLDGARFPWGDERTPNGEHLANVWQGEFPSENTLEDGFYGTAPVDAFAPNGFGLHNMVGNVWEWCQDWFDPMFHRTEQRVNPTGPIGGTHRVMRGGSYLCHESYCFRFRVAARSSNMPDASTGNLGFRVVAQRSLVDRARLRAALSVPRRPVGRRSRSPTSGPGPEDLRACTLRSPNRCDALWPLTCAHGCRAVTGE